MPLKYIIHKNTLPIPKAIYTTEQEESIAIAPLTGIDFQQDNTKGIGIIKQWVLEGAGRS
jgi:hypothetical protein